jgi:hypothetical protein
MNEPMNKRMNDWDCRGYMAPEISEEEEFE